MNKKLIIAIACLSILPKIALTMENDQKNNKNEIKNIQQRKTYPFIIECFLFNNKDARKLLDIADECDQIEEKKVLTGMIVAAIVWQKKAGEQQLENDILSSDMSNKQIGINVLELLILNGYSNAQKIVNSVVARSKEEDIDPIVRILMNSIINNNDNAPTILDNLLKSSKINEKKTGATILAKLVLKKHKDAENKLEALKNSLVDEEKDTAQQVNTLIDLLNKSSEVEDDSSDQNVLEKNN